MMRLFALALIPFLSTTALASTGGKSFLQLEKNIDEENAEASEMARLEAESDKDMGEDDDESSSSDDENTADDEQAFVQVNRNIDEDNAEASEMARLEAESDRDMGEDDEENSNSDESTDDDDQADEEPSLIQMGRNIDDENAEASEMARLEAESDKDLGEDDDDASSSDGDADQEAATGDESFIQLDQSKTRSPFDHMVRDVSALARDPFDHMVSALTHLVSSGSTPNLDQSKQTGGKVVRPTKAVAHTARSSRDGDEDDDDDDEEEEVDEEEETFGMR